MLVFTRRISEVICIGEDVRIQIVRIIGDDRVRIGIDAPRDVPVHRLEVKEAMERDGRAS